MNATTEKGPVANNATVSPHLRHSLTALVLVSFAAGLRVWPLQALESELVWLTFYPAVIASALYADFTLACWQPYLLV